MTRVRIEGRQVVVTVGEGRVVRLRRELLELLDGVRRFGSLSRSCRALGITLKTGLSWLKNAEGSLGQRLVERVRGGKGGGGALLTAEGSRLLMAYYSAMSVTRPGFVASLIEESLSARNRLSGRVESVVRGDAVSLVEVELEPKQRVKAVVTTQALDSLRLEKGRPVLLVVKATDVMVLSL
ncbi:MAG: TOBE domain-containing protein [Nitrososphaerota archaeon]